MRSLYWPHVDKVDDLGAHLKQQAGGIVEDARNPPDLADFSSSGEAFAVEAAALQRSFYFGDEFIPKPFRSPTARYAMLASEPVGGLLVAGQVVIPATMPEGACMNAK